MNPRIRRMRQERARIATLLAEAEWRAELREADALRAAQAMRAGIGQRHRRNRARLRPKGGLTVTGQNPMRPSTLDRGPLCRN